ASRLADVEQAASARKAKKIMVILVDCGRKRWPSSRGASSLTGSNRIEKLADRTRHAADFADHDAGGEIGHRARLLEREARTPRQSEGRDDGIAGAGHIESLLRIGRKIDAGLVFENAHAVFSERENHLPGTDGLHQGAPAALDQILVLAQIVFVNSRQR